MPVSTVGAGNKNKTLWSSSVESLGLVKQSYKCHSECRELLSRLTNKSRRHKLQLSSHGSNMQQWIHIQLTSRLIWIAGHTFGYANWILNTNIFVSQAKSLPFCRFCWLIVLFLFWLHSTMQLLLPRFLRSSKHSFPPASNERLRQRTCIQLLAKDLGSKLAAVAVAFISWPRLIC